MISTNPVVDKALNACGTARNETIREIRAKLVPAKIKEAYGLLKKASQSLDQCYDPLKASKLDVAWPRLASIYGDVRSGLTHFIAYFETELSDMTR